MGKVGKIQKGMRTPVQRNRTQNQKAAPGCTTRDEQGTNTETAMKSEQWCRTKGKAVPLSAIGPRPTANLA